jgi:hypothetical protein
MNKVNHTNDQGVGSILFYPVFLDRLYTDPLMIENLQYKCGNFINNASDNCIPVLGRQNCHENILVYQKRKYNYLLRVFILLQTTL